MTLLVVALISAGCGTKTVTRTVTEMQTATVVRRATPPPLVLVPDQAGQLVYRPDTIGLGASAFIKNIRWRDYGSNLAIGRGLFASNDCNPNCADGKITWVPVTVRLRERILCRGRLAYTLMAVDGATFDNQFNPVGYVIGATREAC